MKFFKHADLQAGFAIASAFYLHIIQKEFSRLKNIVREKGYRKYLNNK